MISKLQYRGEKEDTAARTCDRKDGGTLLPGLATGRMGDTAAGPLQQEGWGTLLPVLCDRKDLGHCQDLQYVRKPPFLFLSLKFSLYKTCCDFCYCYME